MENTKRKVSTIKLVKKFKNHSISSKDEYDQPPLDILAFSINFFDKLDVGSNTTFEECEKIVKKMRMDLMEQSKTRNVSINSIHHFLRRISPGYMMVILQHFTNPCAKFVYDNILENARIRTTDNMDIWVHDEKSDHNYPFLFDGMNHIDTLIQENGARIIQESSLILPEFSDTTSVCENEEEEYDEEKRFKPVNFKVVPDTFLSKKELKDYLEQRNKIILPFEQEHIDRTESVIKEFRQKSDKIM